jgi:hypothetical protein
MDKAQALLYVDVSGWNMRPLVWRRLCPELVASRDLRREEAQRQVSVAREELQVAEEVLRCC